MSRINIDHNKCISCQQCISACPFDAIDYINNQITINDNCRLCQACVRVCPSDALTMPKTEAKMIDKTEYRNALIFVEQNNGIINPVTFELIGEAQRLMNKVNQEVEAIVIGKDNSKVIEELKQYPLIKIHNFENKELRDFRVDLYADCFEMVIKEYKPSVVLVGATALGRALAPKVATRFKTGLTADCTELDMKENTDLVQIRPAFGGNIMAQIVTTNHRPQFATVRYKVMEAAEKVSNQNVEIKNHQLDSLNSTIQVLAKNSKTNTEDISLSDFIVVAGAGVRDEAGLKIVQEFAKALGATFAVTRPLVQQGLAPHHLQVGLSGQTIKPKTLITVGVSGAIQFTAGAAQSEHIIAINNDPKAAIFDVAHTQVVEDLFRLIPNLTERIVNQKSV